MSRTIEWTLPLAVALGMLAGCGTTYQPRPDEVLAPVKLVGLGSPQVCIDGKFYTPPSAADDEIRVPTGARIDLGSRMVQDGYNVIHYCNAWISFVPEAGRRYVSNAGLNNTSRCFIEVVREDASKDTGVSLERSIGKATCTPNR